MSVINILMQLRKVCNHPDLFEPRPIVSSFVTESLQYHVPSLVFNLSDELFTERQQTLFFYQPSFVELELQYSVFSCHRARHLQTSRKLIEEVLSATLPSNTKPSPNKTTEAKFFSDSTLHGLNIVDDHSLQMECIRQQRASGSANLRLKHTIQYLARTNRHHCNFYMPVYGHDLQECVGVEQVMLKPIKTTRFASYTAQSHATCQQTLNYEDNKHKSTSYWSQTQTLSSMLNIVNNNLYNAKSNHEMADILARFVVYVPHVVGAARNTADPYDNGLVRLRVVHPKPSICQRQKTLIEDITGKTMNAASKPPSPKSLLVNQIECSMSTQFPEKRLIKYDCGKLQTLAELLRTLIADSHRVLLFTQMTRMLDILENFLNYHGYKYLRLDGSTSIEQRQVLMERFNNDKRIFCFILSTRSGGIGVNLTGADTVIFYDSDWNPTMDAQAQDRCHRIGQTRDVHIYRLISEKTIEENILKKANQKRLLADMTIEGGCFTTALLKKHHITELFDEEETLDENGSEARLINATSSLTEPPAAPPVPEVEPMIAEEAQVNETQFEDVNIKII